MTEIRIIVHDLRSTHNVGSLLRTCEGLAVSRVYFTGYTPYPLMPRDMRLPHISSKLTKQIHKTALGAETMVPWSYEEDVLACINSIRSEGFSMIALEQADGSIPLPDYVVPDKVAVLLGREVEGIDPEILKHCDACIEIPMFGKKESFNVVQAAAMTLFKLRFS